MRHPGLIIKAEQDRLVRTFALRAVSGYKRQPFPDFAVIPAMTSELHPKLPKAFIAIFALALASASFDVARADDARPGFFKKLFGGGGKTETPAPAPTPEPAKKPASKSKPEPEKTTSKSSSGSKPRVIITTTGGKKVEIGKKTTARTETPKSKEQPVKDVTKTAARDSDTPAKGEFKEDDDDKGVSTPSSKSIEVLPANGGWEIVKIGGRDYVTAESIRNFYNPVYGFTTFRTQGTHFWLGSSKLILKAQVGSQEMLINNIKFILSFPVVEYNGKVLFSRLDLCKLIDPVLYPSHIQNAEYFDTVVVDAGHGGHDAGARGVYGYEKDFALKMAMSVRTALMQRGFKVILTRATDTFITLGGRVAIANQTPKSIFLSFHFNSGGAAATGIETWALTPQSAAATISRGGGFNINGVTGNKQDSANIALATAVHANVISRFKFVDRGIKRAQWSVLTGCKRPGILFEGGFVTNGPECQLVASETYRQQVSAAIGDAVMNYRKALESAMTTKR
jgi:N-acetylmuramoyl-L-alanine amidase